MFLRACARIYRKQDAGMSVAHDEWIGLLPFAKKSFVRLMWRFGPCILEGTPECVPLPVVFFPHMHTVLAYLAVADKGNYL